MGPKVHVGQHKQPTVAVIFLTGHLSRLARHGFCSKVMLLPRMFLSPPRWDRGDIFFLQLALPLMVKVGAQSLANDRQVMAAACTDSNQQDYECAWRSGRRSEVKLWQLPMEHGSMPMSGWQSDSSQTSYDSYLLNMAGCLSARHEDSRQKPKLETGVRVERCTSLAHRRHCGLQHVST